MDALGFGKVWEEEKIAWAGNSYVPRVIEAGIVMGRLFAWSLVENAAAGMKQHKKQAVLCCSNKP